MDDHHEHHDRAPTDANRDARKDTRQTDEAFESVVLRYLDGLHTEEELQRLNEQLATNADCREAFAALCMEAGVFNEMAFPARSTSGDAEPIADERDTARRARLYNFLSDFSAESISLFRPPMVFFSLLAVALCAAFFAGLQTGKTNSPRLASAQPRPLGA